jgi:hypothetical protein
MKEEDCAQCILPTKRTGLIVQLISSVSIGQIVMLGVGAYLGLIFAVSGIEYWSSNPPGHSWVKYDKVAIGDFWDIFYFNSITILTIGYGDFVPNGAGARVLSVAEAFLGTGIITITLSALIAKFLSPPTDAIVFSKYAYYCTEVQTFMVIYMNTTRNRVVNADQSAYFKLAGDWGVTSAVRSPLITRAVQTFYNAQVSEQEIVEKLDIDHLDDPRDVLRFGISGQIGAGSFSVAMEYDRSDIIVLPNRKRLTGYSGFWDVKLDDAKFQSMFHYRPQGSPTLVEYVRNRRQQIPMPDLRVGTNQKGAGEEE